MDPQNSQLSNLYTCRKLKRTPFSSIFSNKFSGREVYTRLVIDLHVWCWEPKSIDYHKQITH